MLYAAFPAMAQEPATRHLTRADIKQYLIADMGAEISLARSAAPEAVSRGAEVLVLRDHGFETAVKGANGFVCLVGRSWTSAADADFWNAKVRVPICFNSAAARSYLRYDLKTTELVLAGRSKDQVTAEIISTAEAGQLPVIEAGAMCFMLSKEGYAGDAAPHWPPHLMFFYPETDVTLWGANLPGSPVVAIRDNSVHITTFMVGVQQWSDGTAGPPAPSSSAGLPAPDYHVPPGA